ncbi:MAG: adenylate kinase [Gemmatimonadota bacterium]
MVVILLGPPGVGKGTQGAILAKDTGWERIATGDLLRAARRQGTELGTQARGYMDAGELVPDDLIVALVKERLEALDPNRGVILDGFPRTVPQAEALDRVLPEVSRRVDGVVLLQAPADVLVKRVAGRRTCPDCGRVYNVHFEPPAREGVCDACGSELTHRSDDQEETVARRLEVYEELTEPLVEHYRGTSAEVLAIDGDRPVDEVQERIRTGLRTQLGAEV